MSLKNTFGLIGTALAILADHAQLSGNDAEILDAARQACKDAEEDYEQAIADDIRDGVDHSIGKGLSGFSEKHSELYGSVESRLKTVEAKLEIKAEPLGFAPPASGSPEAGGPVTSVPAETVLDTVVDPTVGHGGGGTFTQANAGRTAVVTDAPDLGETSTKAVADVTDPATQGDSVLAQEAADDIVPGAATGPDDAGVVRNAGGYVADAPVGSMDAAFSGVQKDNTTGEVVSTGTDPAIEVDKAQEAETVSDAAEEAHHETAVVGAESAADDGDLENF